jgi:serine/threonine protein kinase
VSDLWSIGVLMYELIYKTTPFKKPKNILELCQNIQNMKLTYPSHCYTIDPELKDLISQLLVIDPSKRINWGSFFSHEWFGDILDQVDLNQSSVQSMNKSINNLNYVNYTENSVKGNINPIPEEIKQLVSETKLQDNIEPTKNSSKDEDVDDISSRLKRIMNRSSNEQTQNIGLYKTSHIYNDHTVIENYISSSVPNEIKLGDFTHKISTSSKTISNLYGHPSIKNIDDQDSLIYSPNDNRIQSTPMVIPRKKINSGWSNPVIKLLNDSLTSLSSSVSSIVGSPLQKFSY